MPRGVYERKKDSNQYPPRDTNVVPAEASKLEIGMLALRGYLAAIMLSGGVPDARDIERMGRIIDEALGDG